MCPPLRPPPPAEISLYWSEEEIISFLDEYTPGSRLPNNVLADSSPYLYPPCNYPEGLWYLVHSNERKESDCGFWKARGEACKIYSNSMINGWRTTLEYFKGQAPHEQRTDWLMQEYRVTQTELCDKHKPKDLSRLLCRVFLCNGHGSKSEMNPVKVNVEPKKISPVTSINPRNNITSGQESKSEPKENSHPWVRDDDGLNSSLELFSELECFSRGDYLELNDLEDPESHSSSSQNSSCPSKLSDEYFDSSAFLRDLEEEENKYLREQQSSSRHNFIASVRPNDTVLQPPSSGSLLSNVVEGLRTDPAIHESLGPSTSQGRTNPTIHESLGPSTSQGNAAPSGEKKAHSRRMKKLKLYFCFTPF